MKLSLETDQNVAVVRVEGRLVEEAATAFKTEVRRLLSAGHDVIVDFQKISFADSQGLSALVASLKTARTLERRLVLADLPNHMSSLLELTRLHRIFEIHSSVGAARLTVYTPEVGP